MRNRLIIAGAALAAVAIGPAGAVAADRALNNTDTVSVSAPPASASPGTGAGSGSTGSGSSGSGSGSSGSGSAGSGGYGYGSGGSGSSGGQGSPGIQIPGASTGSAEISGTPVKSEPGVVMVDTVLQGGEGAGTGIVLSSNGIVLTNYHVVDGSTSIRVTDSTGNAHTATVIGHDAAHDIAVLRLSGASGMTTARLDTAAASLGETVTAVGQGGGQGELYKTGGTITDTDQQITASDETSASDSETLTGLLQTDAQIVPGYSGGPLYNAQGEVVGMDTAASSTTPISGYAIPIASAMTVAKQIESGTRTATDHIGARAALGVEVQSGPATSQGGGYGSGGSQDQAGVAVQRVLVGSAAAKAGISAGSTITSVAGHTIGSASQLTTQMATYYPGQHVSVSWVDSAGTTHTATLTLGASSEN